MKKIISILAAAVMLACLSVQVFAADGKISLTTSANTLKPGDTFDVVVKMDENTGFTVLRLMIEYSSDLEIVSCVDCGNYQSNLHCNDYSRRPFILYWNNNLLRDNMLNTDNMAILTFKVSDSAKSGSCSVTAYHGGGDALTTDLKKLSFDITGCSVNIDASETHWLGDFNFGDEDELVVVEDEEEFSIIDIYEPVECGTAEIED